MVAAIDDARAELAERERAGSLSGRAVPIDIVTFERADTAADNGEGASGDDALVGPYREASPQVPLGQEMHEVSSGVMAELVEQVVAVEGPIHVDEVVVRLRTAWGLQRAGGRIQAAVDRGADIGAQRGRLVREGDFLSIPDQLVLVRDRSGVLSGSLRRLEALPPKELEAAVLQVARTGLGATPDEVVAAAPRLLGFKSVGAQLRQAVAAAIARLEETGVLGREAGLLVVTGGSTENPGKT